MKRFILFAAAALLATFSMSAQIPQLPNDPETRVGKLDNGLTYYIRHNGNPENRAEFYLATNVGAIQEEPDQDGLAHFLEHMCFNGTKNFPGKGILNWLESIGASFGGNVNASTGVEQTIYLLNNIPLVRPTVVDTCLLIMHDYAHFVTCDPEEIDKERGVILEEKRSRNTAQWRIREKSMAYLYGDTKYATTSLIGSEENLKNFKPESLVNFYHTWYHPDMQALVVVGDINVDEVEAKIKSTFADIPAEANPKAKDVIAIPDNEEPVIGIITDPESNAAEVEAYWKRAARPEALNSTAAGLMTDLITSIASRIMNERFADIMAKPDAPFLQAIFSDSKLCETCEVTYIAGAGKQGKTLETFEAMMTEAEKMKRFGFTDAEVERAKTEILSQYEAEAKKKDTRKNAEFVMPLIENFFDNQSYMDPETEYQYVQALFQQINTDIVNQIAQQLITDNNLTVIYAGPEREGFEHPTEQQLRDIINKVKNEELERPAGEEIPEAFLDPSALKGSKVKSIKPYIYDSELVTLKNGVRVILLPTQLEKDRIAFSIEKRGGQSLISDEDLYSFEDNIWALYLQNSGVAEFPATTVGKMLSGKQLSVSPYISRYIHGVSGTSTVKDLETALQMAYLYFTQPRFDEDEYNQGIAQIETVLPNIESQPDFKLQEALYNTVYDSPRRFNISQEVLDKANIETLKKDYDELFKDAAGAIVTIIGDFDEDEIIPLVEKYIGSLPKGKKATDWKYCGDGMVNGTKVNDFSTKMASPKVTVAQFWKKDAPYSVESEVSYDALSYILDMIYTTTLREDEGGTYGAQASGSVSSKPKETHVMEVMFETNTESADKLRKLAVDGMKRVAEQGPTADEFDKTVKNLEKTIPESRVHNAYWTRAIKLHERLGIDYDAEYEAAVKALTPEKVKAAAAELVNSGNFIELVMRPESE